MNPIDISLYAILDPNRTKGRDLTELAAASAKGGVTIFQYRDKQADTRTLIKNAQRIKSTLAPFGIPLLINDRVDVALAAGADGVHLGQSDMHVEQARQLMGPQAIIGLTIKEEAHVQSAPVELIDYACIGGVYDTLSKDNPVAIGVDGWSQLAGQMRSRKGDLPVGAIAGIGSNNIGPLVEAGTDGVAVISAIFMSDDVQAATEELSKITRA